MQLTDTKQCSRCDRDLPLDAFNVKAASPDGRQPYCKTCQGEAQAYAAGNAVEYRMALPSLCCRRCRRELPPAAFDQRELGRKHGYNCRDCRAAFEAGQSSPAPAAPTSSTSSAPAARQSNAPALAAPTSSTSSTSSAPAVPTSSAPAYGKALGIAGAAFVVLLLLAGPVVALAGAALGLAVWRFGRPLRWFK